MYEYAAEVVRIVDGDTVRLRVDCGFRMTFEDNFRMARYDAPEASWRAPDEEHRQRGIEASRRLEALLPPLSGCVVKTGRHGKYRWLAEVINGEGENVNQVMIDEGHTK